MIYYRYGSLNDGIACSEGNDEPETHKAIFLFFPTPFFYAPIITMMIKLMSATQGEHNLLAHCKLTSCSSVLGVRLNWSLSWDLCMPPTLQKSEIRKEIFSEAYMWSSCYSAKFSSGAPELHQARQLKEPTALVMLGKRYTLFDMPLSSESLFLLFSSSDIAVLSQEPI